MWSWGVVSPSNPQNPHQCTGNLINNVCSGDEPSACPTRGASLMRAQSKIRAEEKKRMLPLLQEPAGTLLLSLTTQLSKRKRVYVRSTGSCRLARGVTLAEEAGAKSRIPAPPNGLISTVGAREGSEWRPSNLASGFPPWIMHAHHWCGKTRRTVVKSKLQRCQLNHPVLWVYWDLKEKKRTSLASTLPDPKPSFILSVL